MKLTRFFRYAMFSSSQKIPKMKIPSEQLKQRLTAMEYYVTQERGTERAFTGEYNKHKEPGTYHCVVCEQPLFESSKKFDSGSGWPSFYDKYQDSIEENKDLSHGMIRVEIKCSKCDSHLGHVFEDGPKPTGLRYCVNSASLSFKKKKDE